VIVNDTVLTARRIQAAEASGGASADVIYATVTRILHELNLVGDLLDFGAGKGLFTSELARLQRFRSVTGADIAWRPDGLPSGIDNWIVGDLNAPMDVPESSFDVIVAVEVIEHLENPRAIAREWFRLLREGGTIICSTPNNESWRSLLALLLRGHYALFGPASYPAHITALLRKDMDRLMAEAGFEAAAYYYTNHGLLPKMSLDWQAISVAVFRGVRYSDNLVAVARKPRKQCHQEGLLTI
jgi:2-polyprenyl-3-methyl-5-hydroxy-6-metoxy-1,4-benzoquinol methylase